MNFQPKSEAQIEADRRERMKLLDVKTPYDFTVTNAYETTSKSSGRDMLVLELNVHHDGGVKVFKDYIVPETQPDKLFQFCKSIGKPEIYHSGSFDTDDFLEASGKVKLGIEKGGPDGDGGTYPDKNKIGYYVVEAKKPANAAPPMATKIGNKPFKTPADDDDDIPF